MEGAGWGGDLKLVEGRPGGRPRGGSGLDELRGVVGLVVRSRRAD